MPAMLVTEEFFEGRMKRTEGRDERGRVYLVSLIIKQPTEELISKALDGIAEVGSIGGKVKFEEMAEMVVVDRECIAKGELMRRAIEAGGFIPYFREAGRRHFGEPKDVSLGPIVEITLIAFYDKGVVPDSLEKSMPDRLSGVGGSQFRPNYRELGRLALLTKKWIEDGLSKEEVRARLAIELRKQPRGANDNHNQF